MTGRRWSARVAPLAEPTSDGRVLSPVGRFTLANRNGVPLRRRSDHDPYDIAEVGRVTAVHLGDGHLVAHGVVTDDATTRLMQARTVFPEMDLGADVAARVRGEHTIFYRGRITAITVGYHPAWPTVSFDLEERS